MEGQADPSRMPSWTERKWYLYLEDRYHGPFSFEEIELKLEQGAVHETDYAWTHGMRDWTAMKDLPKPAWVRNDPTPTSMGSTRPQSSSELATVRRPDGMKRHSSRLITKRRFTITAIIALTCMALWYGLGRMASFSDLPFKDLSAEDERELLGAMTESITRYGPSAGVAVSASDLSAPSFFVASNLPDGARIDLRLEGVPETLVNRTRASAFATVTVRRGWAQTAPFRQADGQDLPRGEYRVWLTLSKAQPTELAPQLESSVTAGKALSSKTYFLGGQKDASYDHALSEYHDKLRQEAERELGEIEEFASTLENQLSQTVSRFESLAPGAETRPEVSKARWAEFDESWRTLQSGLEQTFLKWSDSAVKPTFFYDSLYSLVQQAGGLISRVHQEEGGYFDDGADRRTLDLNIAQDVSVAQSAILSLKMKLELAGKLPPTANGMPRKDGL